jgi:hypothetical protein
MREMQLQKSADIAPEPNNQRHIRENRMNKTARLMQLFGRVRNDLKALKHSRRDRLRDRLVADVIETLSLIEYEVLVQPHLTEETSNVERTQTSGGH